MDLERERKLVERAGSDPKAFGVLYDHYYPKIVNYTLRRVGDEQAALDITAITFYKAWRNLPKFEWRGVSFSAWLYRLAGNEVNNYFRQSKRKALSLDALYEDSGFEPVSDVNLEAELSDWQDQLSRHQDFLVIQAALKKLPAKYQEVIALRFFEKKSLEEIAAITGKKLNTVKSHLRRGIEKLRAACQNPMQVQPDQNATFVPESRYKLWKKQL